MAKKYTLKKKITKNISKQKGYTYKDTWYCIWQNVLKDGGMRLTPQGFIILGTELDIKFYSLPLIDSTLNHLLNLDKKLECPYYIMPKSLVVFDEKIAFELKLYGNDIDIYLNRS